MPYGQVFTRQEINRALQSENPQEIVPSADINGHGTRLASIAAGNRNLEEGVSGAAAGGGAGNCKAEACQGISQRAVSDPS